MTIGFAGSEQEAFVATGAATWTTTSGFFDSTYSRGGLSVTSSTAFTTPSFTGGPFTTEVWFHGRLRFAGGTGTGNLVSIYNGSGTEIFRLAAASGPVLQMSYWNGASFTNIGSGVSYAASTAYEIDMHVVLGGSGSAELFIDRASATSGSASMTSLTSFDKAAVRGNNSSCGWSQVICADVSTVGWKLYTLPPTGNGTGTAFIGDYTAVDEGTLDDADFVESTGSGDVETFTYTPPTLGSGTVKAVVVSGRVKNSAAENAQLVIRRSGTNYFTSNLSGLGAGFAPFVNIRETDPATSAAWTQANAVAAGNEFGIKHV